MSAFVPREPRRYVGTYRPRIDALEKASGRAEYLDDVALGVKLPGMLHAQGAAQPVPARAHPAASTPAGPRRCPACTACSRSPTRRSPRSSRRTSAWTSMNTAGYTQMYWPSLRDRRVLGDHVTWVGDEAGAVVAAETRGDRRGGAAPARGGVGGTAVRAAAAGSAGRGRSAHPPGDQPRQQPLPGGRGHAGGRLLPARRRRAGLRRRRRRGGGHSRHHRADHGCLDTRGCLVRWQGGKLTCWTNLYQADQTRMHIAEMLDLPLSKVRVICPYVGGSFGRGNVGDQVFFIFTAILARRTGRPVRFKHTRREDFHDTRNAVEYWLRVGATRDGRITALDDARPRRQRRLRRAHARGREDGAQSTPSRCCCRASPPCAQGPLRLHQQHPRRLHARHRQHPVQHGLGLAVDELAEKLGMDPIEVAVKNFGHEWEETAQREPAGRAGGGGRAHRLGARGAPARPSPGPTASSAAWASRSTTPGTPRGRRGARPRPGRHHAEPGHLRDPGAPQAETGTGSNTCAVLACAEALASSASTPRTSAGSRHRHRDRPQGHGADRQLRLVPARRADGPRRGRHPAQLRRTAAAPAGGAPRSLDIRDGPSSSDPESGVTGRAMCCGAATWCRCSPRSPDARPGQDGRALPGHLRRGGGGHRDRQGRRGAPGRGARLRHGDVRAGRRGAADRRPGAGPGRGPVPRRSSTTRPPARRSTSTGSTTRMPTMLDMPEVEPVLLEVWRGAGEYGACGIGESAITCTPRPSSTPSTTPRACGSTRSR